MENYGGGKSTGMGQTVSGKIKTRFTPQELVISYDDKTILRSLAEKVAEIAASEKMKETRELWKKHIKPNRV